MNDTPPRAGLLESALLKLFTRRAKITGIEEAGPAFRLVTLGGDALRNAAWTPGDKIQVQLGGWTQRTYTPMDWDATYGRTRILVYLHGEGPGTQWARALRKGDDCIVSGPRRSIAPEDGPLVVFGDETSLGLVAALRKDAQEEVHALLEVSDDTAVRPVCDRLGIGDAVIGVRRADGGHLAGLQSRMATLLEAHANAGIILTGQAGSIQQMGRALRQHGLHGGRRHAKAYWAPGKRGMD
ncbi:NADPH-dependent ferric siderophore reductase [Pseudoduganella lurida]|uniref:NADPH-dependent ferric siderophore reductase n=1 Tax=Pseudoduganella lurida TaxID=1036180 RepID=A0A562RBW8_9BURK|nr:siderophore-interacting protein [Pseudoduganella lurida]TWI66552.1 NADPH-dependent ferric siderophore reductase [Pseudoduganella lurida]